MYSTKSYRLKEEEYNYLLPVLKKRLGYSNGNYYFIGNTEELSDMLDRLRGLYGCFEEHDKIIDYTCSVFRTLAPFRDAMDQQNYTLQK